MNFQDFSEYHRKNTKITVVQNPTKFGNPKNGRNFGFSHFSTWVSNTTCPF